MIIKTERLTLAPMDMQYAESMYAYAGDAENTAYMMFLPLESMEEAAEWTREAMAQWQSDKPSQLEFAMLHEGRHIGSMTLYFLDDRRHGELGWVVHRDCWNKGFATEAAQGIISRAKTEWGINRIIACCDSENEGSKGVMRKLGMKLCATGKRKNRSSDEERIELIYEMFVE